MIISYQKPCVLLRTLCPYALPLQLTPPGTLTAHEKFCLVLLCSQPDTVHRHPLRETQTSSPLIEGSHKSAGPRPDITPAIADFRYRRPLLSRLHGLFSIPSFRGICQSPEAKSPAESCWLLTTQQVRGQGVICDLAFLSSLTRTRSSLKNCFSMSLHSCSMTPRIT